MSALICLYRAKHHPAVPAKILGYKAAAVPVIAFYTKKATVYQLLKKQDAVMARFQTTKKKRWK